MACLLHESGKLERKMASETLKDLVLPFLGATENLSGS